MCLIIFISTELMLTKMMPNAFTDVAKKGENTCFHDATVSVPV